MNLPEPTDAAEIELPTETELEKLTKKIQERDEPETPEESFEWETEDEEI